MTGTIRELLISSGAITKEQVETVLIQQRLGDTRIFSEIALELGYLDDKALMRYAEYMVSHRANAAVSV
jgi:hypothetical protein